MFGHFLSFNIPPISLSVKSTLHNIKKKGHFYIHLYKIKDIYYTVFLEVPDSMAASPELNWFYQNLT